MSDSAELSSIQRAVEELSGRVVEIADRRDDDPDDPVSPTLYEVDRALRTAVRLIERVRKRI